VMATGIGTVETNVTVPDSALREVLVELGAAAA
jgi:hypothetical protein